MPGKLDSELERALDANVEMIHVESFKELKTLSELCKKKSVKRPILIRMNIPTDDIELSKLAMGGRPSPFGFDTHQLPEVIDYLNTPEVSSFIYFKGFHFHLMSHQCSADKHLKLMNLYFKTVEKWSRMFNLNIEIINAGGGIGVNYSEPDNQFNWAYFTQQLQKLISEYQYENKTIRFECGRFISAYMGCYVAEIIDLKESFGQWFAVVRG